MPERNEDGTFAKGWSGGPGRPPRKIEDAFQNAIISTVAEKGDKISAAMARQALKGDVAAARFLAEYSLGKPTQRIELLTPVEKTLLNQALDILAERGVSAGDAFAALIQLFAEVDNDAADGG